MNLSAYDFAYIGYPLPMLDIVYSSPDKTLKTFRLYGGPGMLKTYVLRRNGYLYDKSTHTHYTGFYVIENPLISYRIKFKDGEMISVSYEIRANPTFFKIPEITSRFMVQSQLLDNMSQECVRITQRTLRQLASLRDNTRLNPHLIASIREMASITASMREMKELPHARNLTIFDLVLMAKAVNAKINITVDMLGNDKDRADRIEDVYDRVVLENDERETLRKEYVTVMQLCERFFSQFDDLKVKEDFVLDPRMLDILSKFHEYLNHHALTYRKAQKRLPVS